MIINLDQVRDIAQKKKKTLQLNPSNMTITDDE
jgi:hypothetical protein